MNPNPLAWDAPFLAVYAALFCIVFCRAGATHLIGRLATRGAERSTRVRTMMASDGYRRAVGLINRWGAPVVSASFLTIGVQTLVQFASGVLRMRARSYVPALVVGSMAWALVYSTIGIVGFQGIALAWQRSPLLTILVCLVLAAALAAFIVRRRLARDRVLG